MCIVKEEMSMNKDNKHSALLGVVLVTISIYIWYNTSFYPDYLMDSRQIASPRTFPRLIALVLGGCGIYECIQGIRVRSWKKDNFILELFGRAEGAINVVLFVICGVCYVFLLPYLGYFISTTTFAFVIMLRLHVKFFKSIFISILSVIFILLLFNLIFKVALPSGSLLMKYFNWRY